MRFHPIPTYFLASSLVSLEHMRRATLSVITPSSLVYVIPRWSGRVPHCTRHSHPPTHWHAETCHTPWQWSSDFPRCALRGAYGLSFSARIGRSSSIQLIRPSLLVFSLFGRAPMLVPLRPSNEHILIVRVLRARRMVWRLPSPPSEAARCASAEDHQPPSPQPSHPPAGASQNVDAEVFFLL